MINKASVYLNLPVSRRLQIEPLEHRRMLATFMVTNNLDGGAGSLREAVAMANGICTSPTWLVH